MPALALTLAGCAGNTVGSSPGAPPAASASAPSAAPIGSPSGPSKARGDQTLTGTVAAGVEGNCLILQSADSHHQLIFDNPELRSKVKIGGSITVVGRAEPGQATTCQQGVPFIVTAVRAN